MKKIIFILLIATICNAQNKEYSISKIDSICNLNNAYGHLDSRIKITNNRNKIIGKGGYSISTYLNYFNDENYNKLSDQEKRKYNHEKDSELVKATCYQTIEYLNKSIETRSCEFYYFDKKLFNLKLEVSRQNKNQNKEVLKYSLNQIEIESGKPIKNIFLLELQKWVSEKNIEILKFHEKS